jgi:hypothetical protein
MDNDPTITFSEFEQIMEKTGHSLYQSFEGKNLRTFKEAVYHHMTSRVLPKTVFPKNRPNAPEVARLPKSMWHGYYAEILIKLVGLDRKPKV